MFAISTWFEMPINNSHPKFGGKDSEATRLNYIRCPYLLIALPLSTAAAAASSAAAPGRAFLEAAATFFAAAVYRRKLRNIKGFKLKALSVILFYQSNFENQQVLSGQGQLAPWSYRGRLPLPGHRPGEQGEAPNRIVTGEITK